MASISTSWYTSRRNGHIHELDMFTYLECLNTYDVYSSYIHKSLKLGATQMSVSGRMDVCGCVPVCVYTYSHKMHATTE